MKRKLFVLILALCCLLVLSGCCFHKEWRAADCTTPKTCVECGEIEGEALGHSWEEATCTTPKTCPACHLTEGEALGHSWVDATTEAPKTCTNCSDTEGERIITDPRFTTASTIDLQGKWYVIEEMNAAESMGLEGFEGNLDVMVTLEFGNEGTMTVSASIANEEEFYRNAKTYMVDAMYSELAAQGIDAATGDQLFEETYGMNVEKYAEAYLGAIDFTSLLGALNTTGVYYVEGDQLYSDESWNDEISGNTFAINGNTLILAGDLIGAYGDSIVFTRVVE